MAFNLLQNISSKFVINANHLPKVTVTQTQVRTYFDARMKRDMKRRKMVTEYAPLRLRINSLRKNDILPQELRSIADEEIAALPRDSAWIRLTNRCVFTSRPRGVVERWRLSRIVFRDIADHNLLSGVQRAMW